MSMENTYIVLHVATAKLSFVFQGSTLQARVLMAVARERKRYAFLSVLISLNSFIDVKLTHNKHRMFNMHNLMSFDTHTHPCKH